MNEMTIESGNDKNNYQGKTDWLFYNRPENAKYLEIFKDNIGSKHFQGLLR